MEGVQPPALRVFTQVANRNGLSDAGLGKAEGWKSLFSPSSISS